MECTRLNSQSRYVSPKSRSALIAAASGLADPDGTFYPYIDGAAGPIPDFSTGKRDETTYDVNDAAAIYRNFLDWLFATFSEDELSFRSRLVARLRLKPGDRVLVTSCGLGDELPILADAIGVEGELFAQDLSQQMVLEAERLLVSQRQGPRAYFSISDALNLPFASGYFDAVFHFGGINTFGDRRCAIAEMTRVTKDGGRVVFGDEGVAPWLRGTEYAEVAIVNNPLWRHDAPLDVLSFEAVDVNCSWVLGNCFYVIDYCVSKHGPRMNIDVPHRGRRGGTARTRFFGQLEGVLPETRERVIRAAAEAGLSVHEWLENALRVVMVNGK